MPTYELLLDHDAFAQTPFIALGHIFGEKAKGVLGGFLAGGDVRGFPKRFVLIIRDCYVMSTCDAETYKLQAGRDGAPNPHYTADALFEAPLCHDARADGGGGAAHRARRQRARAARRLRRAGRRAAPAAQRAAAA